VLGLCLLFAIRLLLFLQRCCCCCRRRRRAVAARRSVRGGARGRGPLPLLSRRRLASLRGRGPPDPSRRPRPLLRAVALLLLPMPSLPIHGFLLSTPRNRERKRNSRSRRDAAARAERGTAGTAEEEGAERTRPRRRTGEVWSSTPCFRKRAAAGESQRSPCSPGPIKRHGAVQQRIILLSAGSQRRPWCGS
jgi:hypothetical protein